MADTTPAIRILVGNLGDASPSGESATLIRTNLEKALSAGIKIKITPDVSGVTGSSGASNITKAMSSLTSGASYAEKQLALLSVRFDTLKQKLNALNDVSLKNSATTELQTQYDAIEKKLTEYSKRSTEIAALEKEQIKQRISALSQLVSMYERLDTAQSKTEGYVELQKYKATSALGDLGSLDTAQAQQAVQIQQQLNEKLDQYAARKTEITAKEKAWVEEQISAIKRLATEQNKITENADKVAASQSMQIASLNQYLTTVNPKALTEFSGEIAKIRTLLASDMPGAAQKASAEITKLKASIKDAGYEGGNAITYINAKLKTFATYLVSSAVTMGFVNGVRTMIENVKDLDAALTDLRIVTGSTREETQELLETYNQMAQRVGSTTSDVASSATSWMRQGYNLEDTDKLIETSMVFSKVGFLDADEAAQALTSTIKGYKLAVEDAMGAIDAFTVLDLDLATSAGEIATALAETASSAEMAGISLEKAASQIGVVLEVTQASGEEIGNFYKTLMARLSNIKAGRLEDPETGESLDTWGIAA